MWASIYLPRGKGYTFGGIMRFKDKSALDAYVLHPSHQAPSQMAGAAYRRNRTGPKRLAVTANALAG